MQSGGGLALATLMAGAFILLLGLARLGRAVSYIPTPVVVGFTTGIACAQVAYKCLTTPTDYPVNDGSFRPLKVVMPMGTVISAP